MESNAHPIDRRRRRLRLRLQWSTLLTGWVLAFVCTLAFAADGRVIALAGTAVAEGAAPGSAARELRTGSEIFNGELIRTGPDGRLQIRFSDGGLVSLQPATEFRIDDYRFGQDAQRSFFSLLRGAVRSATGAIGKRDREDWRMRTPTATVGIRGTEFLAEETVCDPTCSPGPQAGLRVAVTEGRIALMNAAGMLEIGAGQSAVVDSPNSMPRLAASAPVLAPRGVAATGQSDEQEQAGDDEASPAAAAATAVAAAASQAAGVTTGSAPPARDAISPNDARDPGGQLLTLGDGQSDSLTPETPTSEQPVIDTGFNPLPPSTEGVTIPPIAGEPGLPGEPEISGTDPGDSDSGESDPGDSGTDDSEPELPGDNPGEIGPPDTEALRLSAGRHARGDVTLVSRNLPRPVLGLGEPEMESVTLVETGTGPDRSLPVLRSVTQCSFLTCAALSFNGRVHDAGADGPLAWGRWTNDPIRVDGPAALGYLPNALDLQGNRGMHYLVGVPALTIPTSGAFIYDLIGATAPGFDDGSGGPGAFRARASVAFAPGTASIGLDGLVRINGREVGFQTPGGVSNPLDTNLRVNTLAGHTFGGTLAGGGSGCPAADCRVGVDGGLFGTGASHMGIGYTIEGFDGGRATISGVGAFRQGRALGVE